MFYKKPLVQVFMNAIEFANMTPKGQMVKLDFTRMENFDLSKKIYECCTPVALAFGQGA